jgi:hypothetical protein
MQSTTQSLSKGVTNVKMFLPNKSLNKYDVTYIVVVLGLGLASQRGRRFDKSTNEND